MHALNRPDGNTLLGSIMVLAGPDLVARAELVRLHRGQILHEPDENVRQIYFPCDALVSMIYVMRSGASAEAAIVGNDGMVGVAPVLGGESMPYSAVVQCPGTALRLRSIDLLRVLEGQPAMRQIMLCYAQGLLTQMAQTAACSRHHSLSQQLCRWLLTGLDRLPRHEISMTQEGMSHLLGVRREGVTVAAGHLQDAGIIRYTRGRIRVLDRARLEQRSCECYHVVRDESERLQRVSQRLLNGNRPVRPRTDWLPADGQADRQIQARAGEARHEAWQGAERDLNATPVERREEERRDMSNRRSNNRMQVFLERRLVQRRQILDRRALASMERALRQGVVGMER